MLSTTLQSAMCLLLLAHEAGAHARVSTSSTQVPPAEAVQPSATESARPAAPSVDSPRVPSQPALLVENLGQWPEYVRFAGGGAGILVRAECDAIALDVPQGGKGERMLMRVRFLGTSNSAVLVGMDEDPALFHYFVGNDRSKWHSNAHAFREVRYCGLYPDIDLVLHVTNVGVKYDLVVAPGADPSHVRMRIEGLPQVHIPDDGNMTGLARSGFLLHVPGRCYEQVNEAGSIVEHDLDCSWTELEPGTFGLEVRGWDPNNTLVIDPDLVWSTYLGSTAWTQNQAVAFTPGGDVVVTGRTDGYDFPQTSGTYQNQQGAQEQCIVTKFRGADGALLFSSVFGGSAASNRPTALAVDAATGDIAIAGNTGASNFPVQIGAFDSVKTCAMGLTCGFVTKLSGDGSQLLASTFLEGPTNGSLLLGITIIPGGAMIVGGAANNDYPTTPGVFQPVAPTISNAILSKLNTDGSRLVWSTFLSGSGSQGIYHVKLDALGNVVVVGGTNSANFPITPGAYKTALGVQHSNIFVSRLTGDASQLLASTYLGSMNSPGEYDIPTGFGFDAQGNVAVAGQTNAGGFPTTSDAYLSQYPYGTGQTYIGFISRLSASFSTLMHSTFVGNAQIVDPSGVSCLAIDPSGVVTVGSGGHCGYPFTPGAYDTNCVPWTGGGSRNAIVRFSPKLDRIFYSTFIGITNGISPVVSLDQSPAGRIALTGYCESPGGWPTTPNSFQPSYPGGGRAGVVTVLDLLLQGLTLSGTSVPSCLGPLTINGTCMPTAGSTHFSIYCSCAPPSAMGWLLLGQPSQGLGHIGGGMGTHRIQRILPVQSDALGYVEAALPLSSHPAGTRLTAQYVFLNPPGCPGTRGTSASPVLTISVQ